MRMPAEERQMTPFVGPRPIGRGELLFGRDREVRDLIDLLASSRIVLLHSPSGAGKSSLINAGLIPALEAERFHILNVIRVSKELPSLPAQRGIPTEVNRYVLGALLSLEEGFLGAERMDPSNLALLSLDEYLQIREASLDPQDAVILILDQFEEILTLDPIDLKAKAGFFEQLGKALVNRRRWALFAMREDYVGSLDPFLQPLPTQLSVRMRLDLLSEQAARDAIRRPRREERLPPDAAEEVLTRVPSGVTLTENFTEEAAIKLAEDLARMLIQQPDGSRKPVPGPYVEPVQLQVVCERLWSQRPEGATQIDVDALQEVGTVDDALAGYYADKVMAIARDPATVPARVPAGDFARDCALGVDEWRIRDWFDRKLITAEGIRSQVMRGASQSEGLANEAIECLMRAYLVRQERRRGVTWYELAHDRLVDPILGDNKRWRMQHLSPYYARAARWASEKPNPPDLLLRGSELDDMERWQRERGGRLTDDEEAFLEASQEAHGLRQVRRSREAERRTNLAETGWGVILADPALREPLAELLDRRRAQATDRNPAYYQEFSYLRADGARPAETARQFLARHGIGTGAFEPDRVPYYLLIAGDPDVIPFEFQYELDLQYAVGRISFDTPEEYAAYARSVVTAETGGVALSPSAAFFSPQHPGDRTTEIIVNSLVVPTTERLQKARLQPPWEIQPVLREEATKARLGRLLGGPDTPALLVAVGHGLQFPPDDDRHVVAQGAFLCQDWPGPQAWQGPLPPGFYFSAEDVPGDAQLLGLMAFFSASHSAGTPPGDDFAHQQTKKPGPPVRPFVARLAQRLLGHPQGGALAVCGHVDVPWLTEGPVAAVPIFAEVIRRLMDGHTVGSAMEVFDQRYAVFAARASEILRRQMALAKGDQAAPSDWELTTLLTAMVDARNYVIVGDPAVRLPVVEASLAAPRPLLRPVSVPPPPVKLPLPEPLPLEPSRHLAGVHAAFVDLEIDLTRRGAEGYGVAMRLTQSGSDVEVLLASADKTRVQIDVQDLVPSGPPAVSPGGQRLTESLFADPAVRDGFLQARANAQTQGLPLRLRLYLDPSAAELNILPWEALEDPLRPGEVLSMAEDILFSRFSSRPEWRPVQLRPAADLKALVVVANPSDLASQNLTSLDVTLEWERAQRSLGRILITRLDAPGSATLANISARLARGEGYDILYLACRAALRDGVPHLWFEAEDRTSHVVPAQKLISWLAGLPLPQLPRLVVLVAENGARVGPHLLEAGVPAALTIQDDLSLETMEQFMAVFLAELMRDGLIDRAVAAARRAVRGQPGWWQPALFTRLRTVRLFAEAGLRAPFTVGPLPADYVSRPVALEEIVSVLLASRGTQPSPSTPQPPASGAVVAIKGAGGSGKSVLAKAACHDERIRPPAGAFPDGVLWVTLGQEPTATEIVSHLAGLVQAVTGEPPSFTSLGSVCATWQTTVGDRAMLLVIEDVWRPDDLAPFLEGGPHCVRLVTTRLGEVLPSGAKIIEVGAMRRREAILLLTHGLPDVEPADMAVLEQLADRLSEWPLAINLANAVLRDRVLKLGQSLADAIGYLNRSLDRRGMAAFDSPVTADRAQSLSRTLELSLEVLEEEERRRYLELTAFPEDVDVPLGVVQVLWQATGGLDPSQVGDLCLHFQDLSLLQLDVETQHLRLHGVMRGYLLSRLDEPEQVHRQLLDAYRKVYGLKRWADLPRDEARADARSRSLSTPQADAGARPKPEPEYASGGFRRSRAGLGDARGASAVGYLWQHLAYHLAAGGQLDELRTLLLDFAWLQAKLEVAGIASLLADFESLPADERSTSLVQAALQLSAHVLGGDPAQLASQLVGRLSDFVAADLQRLLDSAREWKGAPWFRPLTASLVPPGGPLLRTLFGHIEGVAAVTVSPDGDRAVSASWDGTLKVWDLETGRELHTLAGHAGPVWAVAVTPEGRRVLSASYDKTLKVWSLESGVELRELRGHTGVVRAVAVTPDGQRAVSGGEDRTVIIWDLASGQMLHTLTGHADLVNALTVTPNSQQAISASEDGTLKVWDLETGRELHTLVGHAGPVQGLTLSPDGRRVVSASADNTLKVWDLQSGEELLSRGAHAAAVNGVAFTPDGQVLLSASADRTVKIWDFSDRTNQQVITAFHNAAIRLGLDDWALMNRAGVQLSDLAKDRSGPYRGITIDQLPNLSAEERNLVVAELGGAQELRTLYGHTGEVHAVAVTPDGRRIISGSADKSLKVWDLQRAMEVRLQPTHADAVHAVAMLPGDKQAISASEDTTLKLWDLETGQVLNTLEGHTEPVTAVAVTPDGLWALSTSFDQTLRVWDLSRAQTSEVSKDLRGLDSRVKAMRKEPWPRTYQAPWRSLTTKAGPAAGKFDAVPALRKGTWPPPYQSPWRSLPTKAGLSDLIPSEPEAGPERCRLDLPEPLTALTLSPDGRWVIGASFDGSLKVWDLDKILEAGPEGAPERLTLPGQGAFVWALAATASTRGGAAGPRLLSGADDGTLKLWDLDSGQELSTLTGHSAAVYAVAVFDGGRRAVSASADDTLKVWNLETGRELATLLGHEGSVKAVTVAPDGRWALSAGEDQTLRAWDLSAIHRAGPEGVALLATFSGDSPFHTCAMAASGELLAAGDRAGQVHFLRLEGTAAASRAQNAARQE